jgi:N6-adenosine-specific RNA methylase IME4
MIDNQKGRRNLTDGWKFELAQKKKELLLEKGNKELSIAGKKGNEMRWSGLSTIDKGDAHNTRNELAKDLGWATGKVAVADVVWKEATPEVKEEIKKGDKTFNEAYNEIKKESRSIKIAKQIEEIKKGNLEQPSGKYDVLVVDPPWKVDFDYSPDHYMGRTANPYPEMTVEEIKELTLPAKDDSILWLWTTHSQIWNAIEIMNHWGFEYKGILVWDKESMGIGKWLRKQCEFCLLGTKGKPIWTATDFRDIIREQKIKQHSAKPELFYSLVDKYCVGKKLDYFARKKREGWDAYGDEVK